MQRSSAGTGRKFGLTAPVPAWSRALGAVTCAWAGAGAAKPGPRTLLTQQGPVELSKSQRHSGSVSSSSPPAKCVLRGCWLSQVFGAKRKGWMITEWERSQQGMVSWK